MAAPLSYFFSPSPCLQHCQDTALHCLEPASIRMTHLVKALGLFVYLLCVFTCVSLHMCEFACVWACMYGHQRLTSAVLLDLSPPFFIWHGSGVCQFRYTGRPASCQDTSDFSWQVGVQAHSTLSGFLKMWIPGLELRSLCLINKHFANIAISLAPNLFPFWKHSTIVVTPNELKASILKMSRCNCNL